MLRLLLFFGIICANATAQTPSTYSSIDSIGLSRSEIRDKVKKFINNNWRDYKEVVSYEGEDQIILNSKTTVSDERESSFRVQFDFKENKSRITIDDIKIISKGEYVTPLDKFESFIPDSRERITKNEEDYNKLSDREKRRPFYQTDLQFIKRAKIDLERNITAAKRTRELCQELVSNFSTYIKDPKTKSDW